MSLKMFKFNVENTRTGETASFLGQGLSMDEGWKDGTKNCTDAFRPSSSGAKRPENGIAVLTKNGGWVSRTLRQFESDEPFAP